MIASRYRCPNKVTAHCQAGDGLPRRKTCKACGSAFVIERGAYGVFEWTGTGHYPESAAVERHRTDARAFGRACELGEQYVSRWILAEVVPL